MAAIRVAAEKAAVAQLCCNVSVDVRPAGTGAPIVDSPVRLSAVAGTRPLLGALAGVPRDSIATFLQLLSMPQIGDLLNTIDAQRFPPNALLLDSLLQTAAGAVAGQDPARALGALAEYVSRNPEHADALLTSPSLTPIQGEVRELLHRITQDAGAEAERLVAKASLVVGSASGHPQQPDALNMLALAERFVESAQLVNYFRASELSKIVIAYDFGNIPGVRPDAVAGKPGSETVWPVARLRAVKDWVKEWVARTWRRVPLLVLLAGWLVLGGVCGAITLFTRVAGMAILSPLAVERVFEFWDVGFLALVVIQFYITIRNAR